MSHLKQNEILDWIETGKAHPKVRQHMGTCAECAKQVAELGDLLHLMADHDEAGDLEGAREIRFRSDLRRRIAELPPKSLWRGTWDVLQGYWVTHFSMIGVIAAALLVFSIVGVYKYDKMNSVWTGWRGVNETGAITPLEARKTALAAADDVARLQDVDPADFLEATVGSSPEGTDADEGMSGATGISQDPFHSVNHLDAEEIAQLRQLLKEEIKSHS